MLRASWLVGLVGAAACSDRPSNTELDRELAAARTANDEALARIKAVAPDEPGYALMISGQIRKPGETLGWGELQRIGAAALQTVNPQNPDRKTPTNFRGVLVRDLLTRFEADPAATEATVVAIDGFRATVQLADARAHDMMLALEADGAPIPKSSGGPIFLVHPWSDSEEMHWKYPDRFWSFYVTNLVIGTEEPRLELVLPGGSKRLDRAALEALPHATADVPVGWKVEWPSEVLHLRGIELSAVLAAAGAKLAPDDEIWIQGKAPIHHDATKKITIKVADLERCKPLLTMQFGADEKPITARLGGPIALAIKPCGKPYDERLWVTFVETITVLPR